MRTCRTSVSNTAFRGIVLCLCIALAVSGCGYTVVQIQPPYARKVRPGDGVKIWMKDGTRHSGRVVYVDRSVVVLRTPRQTIADNPVTRAHYASTIPWEEVHRIKVAGTLDRHGQLISNEEIRVNRRTHFRRNLLVNIGLLGVGLSFLAGVQIQDSISPASTDVAFDRHGRARAAFWSTWIGGSLGSLLLGYRLGDHLDRRRSIARIERQREARSKTRLDSLLFEITRPPDSTSTP